MASSHPKLPKFERPPVVEVALSAQFASLPNLGIAQLGLMWNLFRKRFPKVEQHPPIQHSIERKGLRPPPTAPQISFVPDADFTPRLWMVNEAGTELVQMQPDRFVRNWRRYKDAGVKYPHYDDHIRPQFVQDFATFEKFLKAEHIGEMVVDQCEVTYVNHIYGDGVWEHHGQLDRVFRGWAPDYGRRVALETELVSARVKHTIADGSGEFIGRLHIDVEAGFVPGQSGEKTARVPVFVMQLVARGRPLSEGVKGVFEFFDLGHRHIVSTFAEITTEEMHKVWRRLQ